MTSLDANFTSWSNCLYVTAASYRFRSEKGYFSAFKKGCLNVLKG